MGDIEREKVLEIAKDKYYSDFHKSMADLTSLRELLEDTPAADVVDVVRCEYCKYAFRHPLGYIYCHRDGRNAYEMVFKKDSFCSYGERKGGE